MQDLNINNFPIINDRQINPLMSNYLSSSWTTPIQSSSDYQEFVQSHPTFNFNNSQSSNNDLDLSSRTNVCKVNNQSDKFNSSQSKSGNKKKPGKSSYKHIPHREKPPHLVARRNARERRRVQAVNTAFAKLRKCVPVENRNKRLSKVKTLQKAIEYISNLRELLNKSDQDIERGQTMTNSNFTSIGTINPSISQTLYKNNSEIICERNINKENIVDSKWFQYDHNINACESTTNQYYHHYNHDPNDYSSSIN